MADAVDGQVNGEPRRRELLRAPRLPAALPAEHEVVVVVVHGQNFGDQRAPKNTVMGPVLYVAAVW